MSKTLWQVLNNPALRFLDQPPVDAKVSDLPECDLSDPKSAQVIVFYPNRKKEVLFAKPDQFPELYRFPIPRSDLPIEIIDNLRLGEIIAVHPELRSGFVARLLSEGKNGPAEVERFFALCREGIGSNDLGVDPKSSKVFVSPMLFFNNPGLWIMEKHIEAIMRSVIQQIKMVSNGFGVV